MRVRADARGRVNLSQFGVKSQEDLIVEMGHDWVRLRRRSAGESTVYIAAGPDQVPLSALGRAVVINSGLEDEALGFLESLSYQGQFGPWLVHLSGVTDPVEADQITVEW